MNVGFASWRFNLPRLAVVAHDLCMVWLCWAGKVAARPRSPARWALLCDPLTTPLGPLIDALLLDKQRATHASALLGHMLSDEERDWSLAQLLADTPADTTSAPAVPRTQPHDD